MKEMTNRDDSSLANTASTVSNSAGMRCECSG
jgi:hypothetical protein